MFSQATSRIYSMESGISAVSNRISQCENDIYYLKHDMYDNSPLWDKIHSIEFHLNELIATVNTLSDSIEDLSTQIYEFKAATGPQPDVKTAIPNQKSDLEISKQNEYIDLNNIADEKGIWELYDENWYNR